MDGAYPKFIVWLLRIKPATIDQAMLLCIPSILDPQPDLEETARVNTAYVNLVRLWAEV